MHCLAEIESGAPGRRISAGLHSLDVPLDSVLSRAHDARARTCQPLDFNSPEEAFGATFVRPAGRPFLRARAGTEVASV